MNGGGSILDELQLNGVGHGHQSRGKLGYDYTTVFGIGASIGRTTDQDQRQLLQGAREDARLEGFSPYHCCLFFFSLPLLYYAKNGLRYHRAPEKICSCSACVFV